MKCDLCDEGIDHNETYYIRITDRRIDLLIICNDCMFPIDSTIDVENIILKFLDKKYKERHSEVKP